MAPHVPLLPPNATPWERLMSEVRDDLSTLEPAYDGIRIATRSPPPQFLPFLVWQYGLGELTPYLPELYALIDDGVRWQRVRGTPAAITKGLGWIGYDYTFLCEPTARLEGVPDILASRRRWHRFMLELDRVRDADLPDLERIAGIVQLSVPARSDFARGFRGWDIRAGETDFYRTDACLTDQHSGVTLPGIRPRWSFGRTYERDHTLTQAELTAAGAWLDPVPESGLWAEADTLWVDADFLWAAPAVQSRATSIADALIAQGAYFRFSDGQGGVVGFGRATLTKVKAGANGGYRIGATNWIATGTETEALVAFCRTPFGAGAGATAASAAVVFGGTRDPARGPGALWLEPGELTGGTIAGELPIAISFGETVREHVRYLLRISNGA